MHLWIQSPISAKWNLAKWGSVCHALNNCLNWIGCYHCPVIYYAVCFYCIFFKMVLFTLTYTLTSVYAIQCWDVELCHGHPSTPSHPLSLSLSSHLPLTLLFMSCRGQSWLGRLRPVTVMSDRWSNASPVQITFIGPQVKILLYTRRTWLVFRSSNSHLECLPGFQLASLDKKKYWRKF